MIGHRLDPGPVHLVRLGTGDDLYEAATAYCIDNAIRSASVTFLGAVSKASLRYYEQTEMRYHDFEIDDHLEVVAGVGNVSLLDAAPFLHIHAAFADRDGRAFGGHVNVGTEVFALELTISELVGPAPVRSLDEATGLMLWGPDGA